MFIRYESIKPDAKAPLSMSEPGIVTRFAPSPTGYLHVGGARTALFNWLLARHARREIPAPHRRHRSGAQHRSKPCQQLLEDLRWLGLHWDNPKLVFQSKRLDLYNRVIDDLISRGLAYKAYETTEELDAERSCRGAKQALHLPTRRDLR